MNSIELYDTTLRDGAQYEGISLSVDDKIAITKRLDSLGVHYIEGGWPGSNPKDKEYFDIAKTLKLKNAIITAFGSTRRAGVEASDDLNIKALVAAETSVITLVGKSSDLQVLKVLEVSLEENLSMIFESISYLKSLGKRVFFDAEHFFDGYKSNQEYSLKCLKSAESAGAEVLVLCDTNGGTLPTEITNIIHSVSSETNIKLGIHTHNDADSAVAGSIAAVLGLTFGDGRFDNEKYSEIEFVVRAWSLNNPSIMLSLIGLSIVGVGGFGFLLQAYRIADPAVVSPYEYTFLIWMILWGYLIWGDIPSVIEATGMLLIVGAGVYMFYREQIRNRELAIDTTLR